MASYAVAQLLIVLGVARLVGHQAEGPDAHPPARP